MTLHDLYARLTPYEIAFQDRAAVEALCLLPLPCPTSA